MNYWLMNKNRQSLLFSYDEEAHSILKVLETRDLKFAPLGISNYDMEISRKLFNEWWNKRAIPSTRNNYRDVLHCMNVCDSVELLEKSFGLSLSDQYWIKPENSKIEWSDINFFEHEFPEEIGKILLGEITSFVKTETMMSPDYSTGGNLKKMWKIIDGRRCLIKGGNPFNNQEPFNEVVATALYRRLLEDGEYVRYSLFEENGKYYSCCETMVNTDEELVPAFYIDQQEKLRDKESLYEHYVRVCDCLGISQARHKIDKMIVCDYILANCDRHLFNFGVIRNVNTLECTGIAPIFDSGSSLYATTPTINIGSAYTSKPFKRNAYEQLLLVENLTWFNIEKLNGFVDEVKSILSKNPLLEKERIERIGDVVEKNIYKVQELKSKLQD